MLTLIMSRSYWKFINIIVKPDLLSIDPSVLGRLEVLISEQTNKQTKYVNNLTNEEFRELIVGERQQLVSLRNR
jgi:hypothetical protein